MVRILRNVLALLQKGGYDDKLKEFEAMKGQLA